MLKIGRNLSKKNLWGILDQETARWKGIPNGVDETHRRALSDGSSFQKEYTVLPRIFNSDFGLFFEVSNWGIQNWKNCQDSKKMNLLTSSWDVYG